MKKLLLAIVMLLVFVLSACKTKNQDVVQVQIKDETFVIDTVNRTITNNDRTYQYETNGSNTIITYPDNTTYFWTKTQNGGYGGYGGLTGSYDEEKHSSGDMLISALHSAFPMKGDSRNYVLIILLILIGAWNAISPNSSWYLSHGWKYKKAEPSDAALILIRVGGMISIGIGFLLLF